MDELKAWMERQFQQRLVEPNSGLGHANYMLKRWETFTVFLRVPGAPLENNAAYAARGIGRRMPRAGLCRVGSISLPSRGLWTPAAVADAA
jgi:hypothetical protein